MYTTSRRRNYSNRHLNSAFRFNVLQKNERTEKIAKNVRKCIIIINRPLLEYEVKFCGGHNIFASIFDHLTAKYWYDFPETFAFWILTLYQVLY